MREHERRGFAGVDQPKHILKPGTKIITHDPLGPTTGLLLAAKHMDARRPNARGTIVGVVGGHGGDVYWVSHGGEHHAAYCFTEFELADDRLAEFAIAVTYLAAVELSPGERFTIDRYGKSVTFDAAAAKLPFRIRASLDTESDRKLFADYVFDDCGLTKSDQPKPRRELAEGILALPPGLRLHATRLASAHPIAIAWRMEKVGEAHREAHSFGAQITPAMVETMLGSMIEELS